MLEGKYNPKDFDDLDLEKPEILTPAEFLKKY